MKTKHLLFAVCIAIAITLTSCVNPESEFHNNKINDLREKDSYLNSKIEDQNQKIRDLNERINELKIEIKEIKEAKIQSTKRVNYKYYRPKNTIPDTLNISLKMAK